MCPCVVFDRSRDFTLTLWSMRSLLLTGQIISNVYMLTIFAPNLKFFEEKKKSMWIGFSKQVVCRCLRSHRVLRSFRSLELRLPRCVAPYTPCQTNETIKRNAGNDKGENREHYSLLFQANIKK